ncbi:MAG TPA: glutamine--fructose-6-phosphate transaminase (isomerizing) [Candidatus Ornithomonoglobus intestinigallinarum]|uniref:Glutamine--fructose-6-phosphate aminotransferase [isomerizing] n=1 Tax=Candidatus Ornithomonoglobus intestinigallinarum TaxID=2840894 RepID=A0A9D1H3Z8_9FIRM|nr:glutamine--fructose-6-phosphate transaminase (isomerizing) [Candidatus Ornithomonoglobus intestinigallinarum]
MCGIVGYIGERQAAPILLEGLSKLEYRGYDSAGIATLYDGKISVSKAKGRLAVLAEKTNGGADVPGTMGIGHTRWATHGEPSDENAHPHVSMDGRFSVVHNGIIENYIPLKKKLMSKGFEFTSETDTEVIAHLFEYYYKGDIIDAMIKVIDRVEGSYAIGVLCADYPDRFVAVRKASPMIIGLGEGENFIASDVTAILGHTRNIYYLEDDEIVVLKKDEVTVYNTDKEEVEKEVFTVNWDVSAAEKGGYEHFMMKEIEEQPKALRETISPRIKDGKVVLDDISLTTEDIKNIRKVFIVACGSAYHVGVVGKYVIEKMCRIPVEVQVASEFRYCDPIVGKNDLVIVISQSGETADTLAALKEAKNHGARILSIVNVVGSAIANASDDVIYTWAGPEIAVATTKAYSTQLAVMYLISIYMAEKLGMVTSGEYAEFVSAVESLPDKVAEILENKEQVQYLASKFYNCHSIFFIGRNLDYAVSLEGSLKLKEISYIHSEAYAAGELKHGTISLIEDGTLVIALATGSELFDKTVSNVKEVKARGAVVMGVTTTAHKDMETVADHVIELPAINETLLPSLSVIPLQLFGYYVASLKGCDIDKPRNLAKSVTVE